jgi:serine/threonine protein kinase
MIGTQLDGRYRIERQLGEGGMGVVYAATDLQLDRRVAIKVLRSEVDDPVARKRFLREARAAAALSHPNACRLFEVHEESAPPYLVMELLEGESLSDRLERGPLSRHAAAQVLLPLMDAVAALHRAGLVHRDIKPANVFLTADGVKLLDFGLARHTERDAGMTVTAVTTPGAVTGTMRYMAPEQLTGDPVDARTDIFALGVLLFELVTGRIPFAAETNLDWLQSVLRDDVPAMDDPQLAALDPIVSRALQRRPADRYERVDEMAEALRAVVSPGAPVPEEEPRRASERSAVVLPFRLLQPDGDIGALEHGIPEALTALLASRGDLRVLSNRVAQAFDAASDLVAIGERLGIDRLLTGSLIRGGSEVRVTAQWIDATDGAVIWSLTLERPIDSVLALQDSLSREIAEALLSQAPDARPLAPAS